MSIRQSKYSLYDKTQLITKYSTNFTKETNERQKPPYVYKTQSREHRFQRHRTETTPSAGGLACRSFLMTVKASTPPPPVGMNPHNQLFYGSVRTTEPW
ncbi:hypothetical protein OUZ56_033735 [Daphnia magna]|uniref:Uncharacterized protein n=1 Tax=Daphnia magna TaxID=35525 RepID=A0ABR0BB15_9CRUS|nr:hypothetical protein OUZ56_033735 [Daphnia magna]